jgi:hypothetical protein
MADHKPVEPDPRQIAEAQKLWYDFGVATKYSIIGVVVVLLILAAAFTDLI